jgi:transposase
VSMVVCGIDPHKSTLTAVTADEVGRKQTQRTVPARPDAWFGLLVWARGQADEVLWAIEDGRGLAGGLIRYLLAAGQCVVLVPPKLMARARASARTRGKSDPIDALAIARAAQREDGLPVAHLDQDALDVRLLVDHHDTLVEQRTATINRLRWHLYDLDPALEASATLTSTRGQHRLAERLRALPASVRQALAVELLADITALTGRIRDLEQHIGALVRPMAPTLLAVTGIGVLTAAKIIGETGGITRFPTSAVFAAHNGTAPIPIWTGNKPQFRLSRSGNRQLNAALHRMAITQLRHHPPARDYVDRYLQRRPHATRKAALRALKRHLSDVVYKALITDLTSTNNELPAAA